MSEQERYQVGDRIEDAALPDDRGVATSLSSLAPGGRLVVLLYRGYW